MKRLALLRPFVSTLAALATILSPFSAAPPALAATVISESGFETSFASQGWTKNPSNGHWNESNHGYTGKSVKGSGDTNDNPDHITKYISTNGYSNLNYSFTWKACDLDDVFGSTNDDYAYAEYTLDGVNWVRLLTISDSNDSERSPVHGQNEETECQNQASWNLFSGPLPSGANNNPNLGFRFSIDFTSNEDFLWIDNVKLTGDLADSDSDGIVDSSDNCPVVANVDQLNTDGDALGDVCDTDDDGDGVLDAPDNCPLLANADQTDADVDGIGDVCDPSPTSTPEPTSSPVVPPCSGSSYFDNFTLGTVNGQQGWSSTGSYDQAIVPNTYGYPTFGCQSLRLSNAVTSGAFGDQTFSFSVTNEAGETDALNGGLSGGTRQNHFEAQFDFGSTMPTQQPGLVLSVSPDRGDGARMSYLRFEDKSDGIHVFFDDVLGTGPISWNESDIATLSRTAAHTIKLVMDFVDGPTNDVVRVYIDGGLVHTGTSWENYYRFDSESNPTLDPTSTRTVDSLIFRAGGASVLDNNGKGLVFDNVSLSSGMTGEPTPTPTPENGGGGSPAPGTIIVKKVIVGNASASYSDFRFQWEGYTDPFEADGQNEYIRRPGTYVIAEVPDEDYITAYSGDCDSNGTINLQSGATAICTITNTFTGVAVSSGSSDQTGTSGGGVGGAVPDGSEPTPTPSPTPEVVTLAATPTPTPVLRVRGNTVPTETPTPSATPEPSAAPENLNTAAIGSLAGIQLCVTSGYGLWMVSLLLALLVLLVLARRRGLAIWLPIAYAVVWGLWGWQLCHYTLWWLSLVAGAVAWGLSVAVLKPIK